jgi:hypothetical protein
MLRLLLVGEGRDCRSLRRDILSARPSYETPLYKLDAGFPSKTERTLRECALVGDCGWDAAPYSGERMLRRNISPIHHGNVLGQTEAPLYYVKVNSV